MAISAKAVRTTSASVDATPERLRRAGNDNVVEVDAASGVRTRRMTDNPLMRLALRGQLDADADLNRILYDAGARYAEDIHLAGLDGAVGSMDYSKPIVDGGGGGDAFGVGRLQRIDNVNKARALLGKRYLPIVDAICITQDENLTSLGKKVSGVSSPHACRAIAIERLIAGLYFLSRHYRLVA